MAAVFSIKKWLGLNQAADGDTGLKNGELSEMKNFRVTREGHMQTRGGTKTVLDLRTAWDAWKAADGNTASTDEPVLHGAWEGQIGASRVLLCAFGGVIFKISISTWTTEAVGVCTQAETTFFGFANKVYLMNGHEYKVWDGTAGVPFSDVTGYIPTVETATPPAGGGTILEAVNRLNGFRRVKFSPDGTSTVFHLPEQSIDEIVSVNGTAVTNTANLAEGTVTFSSALTAGTNTLEIVYRKGNGTRSEVTGMKFCELYNGASDARVFLYGDGTNRAIYSGLETDGKATAEYFPDLYELRAGDENTPITSMVRHYNRLLCFKRGSAWSIAYGTISLATSETTAAFYVSPVNRQYGNDAPGQVRLMENDALTLDGRSAYMWRATSSSGNYTDTSRNCVRISDRVENILKEFDFSATKCFNYQPDHEFFIFSGTQALIYNYAVDAWYLYTEFPAEKMLEIERELYLVSKDGKLKRYSRDYRNDDGADLACYAATGSMDFNADWRRKYATLLWVAIKPESGARVTVTAESNRKSEYPERVIASGLSTFLHVDFAHWSFGTNRHPQVKRVKLKIKKATFIKLIFSSVSAASTATILSVDEEVRYGGNVK